MSCLGCGLLLVILCAVFFFFVFPAGVVLVVCFMVFLVALAVLTGLLARGG